MAPRKNSVGLTQVVQWNDGNCSRVEDYLAGEEPLEMRVGRSSLGITLRTPGNDDELVAGFLFTEGIISKREDLAAIRLPGKSDARQNIARVTFATKEGRLRLPSRRFSAGSACGICGKPAIAQLRSWGLHRPDSTARFDPEILCGLPPQLRDAQAVFDRTGGLHAAALFDADGNLVSLREDIGRHNAVDKVVGWAFLNGRLPLSSHILLVSGRGGFEIIQKAIRAGVPLLASVSAPSSLAVQLAREMELTLIGFLRGRRFVIYSGEERVGVSVVLPASC